jgi:hypothetical protein
MVVIRVSRVIKIMGLLGLCQNGGRDVKATIRTNVLDRGMV